jgi:hypothetical protein
MSKNIANISRIKDRIYVNMILQNQSLFSPTELPVFNAEFDNELTIPIVENASEYYVAVESLTISTANIPVWRPVIQPNLAPYNNTNSNKTIYSFSMKYNGITSDQTFVLFESQQPNAYYRPLSATNLTQDRDSLYYWIFTYSAFVEMLNQCLIATFANLSGKIVLPTTDVPYITYDPSTRLFSLVANKNYYGQEVLLPIEIYCNYYLYELIYSLPQVFLIGNSDTLPGTGLDVQLLVYNQHNNVISPSDLAATDPGDYYEMKQNYSTISVLSPMKSMVIATQNIPVEPEIAPLTPLDQNRNPGTVTKLKVLEDFEPLPFSQLVANRNYVQYRSSKYSLIDLNTIGPIQHLDLAVYWRDVFGHLYLVELNNNQPGNVRIVFIKKSSYNARIEEKQR